MYHRPVCAKCEVEMRPEKNGVGVLDMADFGPYCIWEADLYKCPKCGYQIIVGFGEKPWAHHYEENFDHFVQQFKDKGCLYKSNQ